MAASTETRNSDTRERDRDDYIDADRRLLAGWDQKEALQDWFDAALTLHRDWLDLITKSYKMLVPYRTN